MHSASPLFSRITRLFIANRSEVARRICATANSAGIETICPYTAEEQSAPHLREATFITKLPGSGSAPYLDGALLIAHALSLGANALHPGYGFLSEDHTFARAVIAAGLIWVGPHPDAIEQMGSKSELKKLLAQHALPALRSATCNVNTTFVTAAAHATEISYPLMIKIAHGGGGRGITLVTEPDSFELAYNTLRDIRNTHYPDSPLLLERYMNNSKHIEVQIAGDGENIIHLFDRECSLQRRNQKVIEEAPASHLAPALRAALARTACTLGSLLKYDSIGTVEFLVDTQGNYAVLEVNTRLQVEHTITEEITGVDLVLLQLILAETKQLPFTQEEITARGHSIEVRINGEYVEEECTPATGTITTVDFPPRPGIRVEHSLAPGVTLTPHVDNMLAKIIATGRTREEARTRLIAFLRCTILEGVATNRQFLEFVLASETFIGRNFTTTTLQGLILTFAEHHAHANKTLPNILQKALTFVTSPAVASLITMPTSTETERECEPHDNTTSLAAWRDQKWNS